MQGPVTAEPEPPADCPLCPRLVAFREQCRAAEPGWHNAPVPTFGSLDARFLIVGLAPGLRGANRTGRPFTGDYAGELLYRSLLGAGFAEGRYLARPDDGLRLVDAAIANAVRCVPPENKPTPPEIRTCRRYLEATVGAMANLRAVLALGKIAHDSVATVLGLKPSAAKFAHGARHEAGPVTLFDSYHCSRLNTNTGRLTEAMFVGVIDEIRRHLEAV